MFQVKIIDSYQLQTYERVMECVNTFCASNDVVDVKSDVKKDDIIYSIVYRISPKKESGTHVNNDNLTLSKIVDRLSSNLEGLKSDRYYTIYQNIADEIIQQLRSLY